MHIRYPHNGDEHPTLHGKTSSEVNAQRNTRPKIGVVEPKTFVRGITRYSASVRIGVAVSTVLAFSTVVPSSR